MSNVGQRQFGSTAEAKLPDLRPHGLERGGADGGTKAAEQRVVPRVLNQPGPKAVSEEVKLDVRILAFALSVPAVDDPGLRRMHFQTALRQPGLKRGLEGQGFLLRSAVNKPVISIPTPWEVGMCPCHPEIKCVMHEQIREDRANNTALRGTARTLHPRSILEFHRRLQPSFDVQQRPFAFHVLPNSP